jgi:hypothetical protein
MLTVVALCIATGFGGMIMGYIAGRIEEANRRNWRK